MVITKKQRNKQKTVLQILIYKYLSNIFKKEERKVLRMGSMTFLTYYLDDKPEKQGFLIP